MVMSDRRRPLLINYPEVINGFIYCLCLGDAVLVHILVDLLEHSFSSGSITLTPRRLYPNPGALDVSHVHSLYTSLASSSIQNILSCRISRSESVMVVSNFGFLLQSLALLHTYIKTTNSFSANMWRLLPQSILYIFIQYLGKTQLCKNTHYSHTHIKRKSYNMNELKWALTRKG